MSGLADPYEPHTYTVLVYIALYRSCTDSLWAGITITIASEGRWTLLQRIGHCGTLLYWFSFS